MKIIAEKLLGKEILDRACSFTVNIEVHVKSLYPMYKSEHSPIRTQIFWIGMYDIPVFVSTHFVRHSAGISHFVKSNRVDSSSHSGDLGRMQPTNHAMFLNAQSLINLSRKRLCHRASKETREVMIGIQEAVALVDPDLALAMVPDCAYRGKCYEFKPCGKMQVKGGKE